MALSAQEHEERDVSGDTINTEHVLTTTLFVYLEHVNIAPEAKTMSFIRSLFKGYLKCCHMAPLKET